MSSHEEKLEGAVTFHQFNAPLDIRYDPVATSYLRRDYYRVTRPFKFYIDDTPGTRWVYVYEGFLTDGASIPALFRSILPAWGVYGQAAVVHDLLCDYRYYWDGEQQVPVDLATIDGIFNKAMRVAGVPRWKRKVIYTAVYWFHRLGYRGSKKKAAKKRELEAMDYWKNPE